MQIPPPFTPPVYSQAQRPDSHTLYTLFPLFECLLFTALHPMAQPRLASDPGILDRLLLQRKLEG